MRFRFQSLAFWASCAAAVSVLAKDSDGAVFYSLGTPSIHSESVRVPVDLIVDGQTSDRVVYISIDVGGSLALTTPTAKLALWSFDTTDAAIDSWNRLASFGTSGFESLIEFETTAGLGNGTWLLGHVVLDAAALNLTLGQTYTVRVDGPSTAVGLEDPSQVGTFRFVTPTFSPASQQFTFVVPEPSSLGILAPMALCLGRRTRSADGRGLVRAQG